LGNLFWVGIGGAVGAILRYVVAGHVQEQVKLGGLPVGTLTVNVLGCLLIGLLSHAASTPGRFTHEGALFLTVGMLGAFTTFSAFGKEVVDLFQAGRVAAALVYAGAQMALGLAAVGGGYGLGRVVQP
jgi:CrcB protein